MSAIAQGGCSCSEIRYELYSEPLFVHGCHCTWCQRETGSAFAVNILIETKNVVLKSGEPVSRLIVSASGAGQTVMECPTCGVVVWSHYSSAKERIAFVRGGTLDEPGLMPPDIHIFTESKQTWVGLPDDVPAVPEYYRKSKYWPKNSLDRYNSVMGES